MKHPPLTDSPIGDVRRREVPISAITIRQGADMTDLIKPYRTKGGKWLHEVGHIGQRTVLLDNTQLAQLIEEARRALNEQDNPTGQ